MAQKRRGPERGRGTEGPGPGMRVARGAGARGGQRARGGGGPRAPSGPQGREEGDAVPGRDVTTLGRTHETLVEADQPRLPVVVENQNRLNHRCRPRSSPPGCSQKTPTSATTRTLPVGAPRKVPRRKRCPAPRGRAAKSPASRSRRRSQGPRRAQGGGAGGDHETPSWGGSSPRSAWPGRGPGSVSSAQAARLPHRARGRSRFPRRNACAKRRGAPLSQRPHPDMMSCFSRCEMQAISPSWGTFRSFCFPFSFPAFPPR